MVATYKQVSYRINASTKKTKTNKQKKPEETIKETSRSSETETGQQLAQLHVS